MTMATIYRAANDPELQARVFAAAHREMIYDDALANSAYGRQLRQGVNNVQPLMYPIAVDTEAAYESAVNSGRGAPGHDVDIITDAALTSAVTTHWPWTVEEEEARKPAASFVLSGQQGQVTVVRGTPGATYTVQWGEGGPGALPIDGDGGAFAGHDYSAPGTYGVSVLDENGDEIAGSTSLVVSEP